MSGSVLPIVQWLIPGSPCAPSTCQFGLSGPLVANDAYVIVGTLRTACASYSCGSLPAIGTSVLLDGPNGVASDDQGNVFIADAVDQVILEINHQSGIVQKVAGTYGPQCLSAGHSPGCGDGGQANSAYLYDPESVAWANGNLYIVDATGNSVRQVTKSGVINTVVGDGARAACSFAACGDTHSRIASGTRLDVPHDIAVDSFGDLIIADTGDNAIRYVPVQTDSPTYGLGSITPGDIYTIAGNPGRTSCSSPSPSNCGDTPTHVGSSSSVYLKGPDGVAVDSGGTVFIADTIDNVIRALDPSTGDISSEIGTYTGCGDVASCGDGSSVTLTSGVTVDHPWGLTVGAFGSTTPSLLIADRNDLVVRQAEGMSNLHGAPIANWHTQPVGGGLESSEFPTGSNPSDSCNAQVSTSLPINLSDGTFWHNFDLLSLPAGGQKVDFSADYSSYLATTPTTPADSLEGWSFSTSMDLLMNEPSSGDITVVQENGAQDVFTASSLNGPFTPAAPRIDASLVYDSTNGTYVFTRSASETFTFGVVSGGPSGVDQILSQSDRNGDVNIYSYSSGLLSSVQASTGGGLYFGYNGYSQLTSVSDSTGRSIGITYSGTSSTADITSLIDADGGISTFTYTGHAMDTLQTPANYGSGNEITNSYNGSHQVTQQEDSDLR